MDDNFSPRVKDVISYSKEEALRLGQVPRRGHLRREVLPQGRTDYNHDRRQNPSHGQQLARECKASAKRCLVGRPSREGLRQDEPELRQSRGWHAV